MGRLTSTGTTLRIEQLGDNNQLQIRTVTYNATVLCPKDHTGTQNCAGDGSGSYFGPYTISRHRAIAGKPAVVPSHSLGAHAAPRPRRSRRPVSRALTAIARSPAPFCACPSGQTRRDTRPERTAAPTSARRLISTAGPWQVLAF